jgi:DNA polymerase-3 subunit alpha
MMIRDAMNKRVFVPLVEAGAMDEFGYSRLGLIGVVEEILASARKAKKQREKGLVSLFEDDEDRFFNVPKVEYSERQRLNLERKVMGVYVSGHPMDGLESWVFENSEVDLTDLADLEDGQSKWVAGLVSDFNVRTTRGGAEMAHFLISNHEISVNVIAFPKVWDERVRGSLEEDTVARLRLRPATSSHSERDYILIDLELCPEMNVSVAIDETEEFKIRLPDGLIKDTAEVSKLKGILLSHRGSLPVRLHLGGSSVMALPNDYAVDGSDALIEELRKLCFSATGITSASHSSAPS